MGRDKKLSRGVVGEIEVGTGVELISGLTRAEGPQLEGRSEIPVSGFGWHLNGTDHRHVFEWTVKGSGTVKLTAFHDRAGRVSAEVDV